MNVHDDIQADSRRCSVVEAASFHSSDRYAYLAPGITRAHTTEQALESRA